MALRWGCLLAIVLLALFVQPAAPGAPTGTVTTLAPTGPQGAAMTPSIRYVPGSTIKLEQLIGDEDKERHQPTRSQTVTRYQLQGTDLGNSFEHQGLAYFLFGDTVGRLRHRVLLLTHALGTVERAADPAGYHSGRRPRKVIHDPHSKPDDGLAGPVIGKDQAYPAAIQGGAYAPYVVERWTKVQGSDLDLYYVLSTWNPYVVVLMKSRLRIE